MSKKIIPIIFTAIVGFSAFFSCKKTTQKSGDQTQNYFPVELGKFITYNVDSILYFTTPKIDSHYASDGHTIYDTGVNCSQLETRTQLKYAISDTFRDNQNRLSYLMDVYYRPHDGATWTKVRVILLTPATIIQSTTTPPPGTPVSSLLYSQDGAQFIKMVYPIQQGLSWAGNANIDVNDPALSYYKNWNYTYTDVNKSYNNGFVNYDNTVTVIEDNESVNYPQLDSAVYAYRIYAKEVYAFNVGMIYKEWTHWTYLPYNAKCINGYTVIMRAIDHN